MLLDRFLPRIEFDSYEDFKAQDKKDPNVANGLTKAGANYPPLAPPILIEVK